MKRRNLLHLLPTGLFLPSLAFQRSGSLGERKFLFVFCDGGWDPTMVFAPMFGNPHVFKDSQDTETTINGLSLVDSSYRPTTRSFFEEWGQDCLIINGIDFETVAHDRGKKLLMTGVSNGPDDWPAIISGSALDSYTAPHLILSGPNYSSQFSGSILRMGQRGELNNLVESSDQIGFTPNNSGEELVEAYLRSRAETKQMPDHHAEQFQHNYLRSHSQLRDLINRSSELNLYDESEGEYGYDCNQSFMASASIALDFFEQGLSRSAIVQDQGYCDMRWDSHGNISEQSWHYELLFEGLKELMTELHMRQSPAGNSLASETTVVVCSELGRHPSLNEMGGKHHWPVSTAMVIGGVTGGRTIGGFSEQVLSKKIDTNTCELSNSGEKILPGHLGATLLALADIDPAEYVEQSPLWGIIE